MKQVPCFLALLKGVEWETIRYSRMLARRIFGNIMKGLGKILGFEKVYVIIIVGIGGGLGNDSGIGIMRNKISYSLSLPEGPDNSARNS
jgi:hypothetical protein